MANQELQETELAYLAGLWDGEGTFNIQKIKRADDKTKHAFWVRSSFTNTNEVIFNIVIKLLNKMQIEKLNEQKRQRRPNWRPSLDLSISRLRDNEVVIGTLLPFLCGKQDAASLVLNFVKRRLATKKVGLISERRQGRIAQGSGGTLSNYTIEDDQDYERLRLMNQKGKDAPSFGEVKFGDAVLSQTDAAYLAGIWDAEGCFAIKRSVHRNGHKIMSPRCLIDNTNIVIISRICEILFRANIVFNVVERSQAVSTWKNSFRVEVRNHEQVLALTELLKPYLTGKKRAAILVGSFAASRLRTLKATGNNQTARYTMEEHKIFRALKVINAKGLKLPSAPKE